jgi:hypothetical protein
MNWGHKITIVFIAFAAMMIYMVVRSFQANVDLVSEDYYLQELNYQEQIDKKQNLINDKRQVTHQMTDEGILLNFSRSSSIENIKGTVNIYRPSEADMDQTLDISLDSQYTQLISPRLLSPGKYVLKIDWSEDETLYYQEIELLIPGV